MLADIACKLSLDDASRYLDPERKLCAMRIGGWSPLDLQEHNAQEARRDEAEGVRLAYVAATRARDVLVVPAVGDGPFDKGWIRPLNRALYPPSDQWESPSPARGVPFFKGKQTIMPDARADGQPVDDTVRPGTYQFDRSRLGERTRWCGGIRCCWKRRRTMHAVCAATISSPRMPARSTSPPIARATTSGASGAPPSQDKGSVRRCIVATATQMTKGHQGREDSDRCRRW